MPPLPRSDLVAVGQREQLGQPGPHRPTRFFTGAWRWLVPSNVVPGGGRERLRRPRGGPWTGPSRSGRRPAAGRRGCGYRNSGRRRGHCASMAAMPRISARIAAIAESATLAVDAKAKALKAAGEPSSASVPASPTSRPRPTSWRPPWRPAATPEPQVHAPAGGLPELREAIAVKTQRDSGYEVKAAPGAGHQRRQAGRVQHVRRPARPRATRCSCPRPTGRPTPRPSPWPAACPSSCRPTRRPASGSRSTSSRRPAPPHQGAAVRVAVEPDRRRLPPGGGRGHRPLGRRARASGWSPTRSTSTSCTATTHHSMPVVVPELADTASSSTAWPRPTP